MDSIWPEGEFEGLYRKRASDGMFVTRWLYDMFRETITDLKDTLLVTPESEEGDLQHRRTKRNHNGTFERGELDQLFADDDEIGEDDDDLEREKRGILGGIAVGIALRNAYKIYQVEQHLSELTSKYNEVVDSTMLLSDKHVQLTVDTLIIKNLVKVLITRNYHKIITYVLASNNHFKRLLYSVQNIIRDGRQKKLSPSLIFGKELQLLFTKLNLIAIQRGCQMILKSPSDLYKVETTYAYEKNGAVFAIYVHVPMVEKEEKLKLYEYVKFPIVQSFKANATIIPDVGEETNIAVVPIAHENRATESISQHRFRTLSELDIQSCMKINDVHLCGGRNTLRTDIENSCICLLYTSPSPRDRG